MRCITCHHALQGRSPGRELTERVWRNMVQVVERASDVTISGSGEPLLHARFVELLREIGGSRSTITLFSSMNPWGTGYAEAIGDCVNYLNCSMDAATEETFSRIRVGADFHRVKRNIGSVVEYRRQRGFGKERLDIRLCFVVLRDNIEELPMAADLASELGADTLLLQPFFEIVRLEQSAVHPDLLPNLRDAVAQTAERCRQLGIGLLDTMNIAERPGMTTQRPRWISPESEAVPGESLEAFPWEKPEQKPTVLECTNPHRRIMIHADGTVLPCWRRYYPMGNLNDDSFEAIWTGPLFRKYRERMLRAGQSPCRGCVCERWIDEPSVASLAPEIRPEDMTDLCRIVGWWDLERDGEGRFFRWTHKRATLFLPHSRDSKQAAIRVAAPRQSIRAFAGAPLLVEIAGQPPLSFALREGESSLGIPLPRRSRLPFIRLDLHCPATFNPRRDYGASNDSRDLGIVFLGASM